MNDGVLPGMLPVTTGWDNLQRSLQQFIVGHGDILTLEICTYRADIYISSCVTDAILIVVPLL
eukprot:157803-Amorphochlora_amoeboformis.AAC.1